MWLLFFPWLTLFYKQRLSDIKSIQKPGDKKRRRHSKEVEYVENPFSKVGITLQKNIKVFHVPKTQNQNTIMKKTSFFHGMNSKMPFVWVS